MPVIIHCNQMSIQHGNGWMITTLADAAQANMVARRWLIEPNVQTAEVLHGDCDQLLYVIAGSGTAVANGVEMPLDYESVLWLEPGDCYHFVAGAHGMEILQGYSPE